MASALVANESWFFIIFSFCSPSRSGWLLAYALLAWAYYSALGRICKGKYPTFIGLVIII
nr:MAG TPA: hypothetical protein [Caudoviricetes sp.]